MYAVIKTGGKQYKVAEGQTVTIERLGSAVGADVTFTPVLVVDGDKVVSTPAALAAAKVTGTITGEAAGPKIIGYTYKSKARVRRRWGHRQHYVTVKVTGITA